MNPIQFALADIRDRIPDQILNLAFMPKPKYPGRGYQPAVTLEQSIIDKVINGRVRRLIDAQGAQEVVISLDGLPREDVGYQAWTCFIPKEMTKGRSIVSVTSVNIGIFGAGGFSSIGSNISYKAPCGMDNNLMLAKEIIDNTKPMAITYTPNVYLCAENTIYCDDRMPLQNIVLRCMVSSDPEFSFIQGGYLTVFAQLCVLATKAYIANKMDVILGEMALSGGSELPRVRDAIDNYRDADEQLLEFYQSKWRKVQRMADKPRRQTYLNMLMAR